MLIWNTTQDNDYLTHTAIVSECNEQHICKAIEACADKAISLLKNTIQDDSLYLLFEWDTRKATLSIVVTDANKTNDSTEKVVGVFSGLDSTLKNSSEEESLAYIDTVKFWLHDYLTTCTAFFSYSLVAIFHSSIRSNTELL